MGPCHGQGVHEVDLLGQVDPLDCLCLGQGVHHEVAPCLDQGVHEEDPCPAGQGVHVVDPCVVDLVFRGGHVLYEVDLTEQKAGLYVADRGEFGLDPCVEAEGVPVDLGGHVKEVSDLGVHEVDFCAEGVLCVEGDVSLVVPYVGGGVDLGVLDLLGVPCAEGVHHLVPYVEGVLRPEVPCAEGVLDLGVPCAEGVLGLEVPYVEGVLRPEVPYVEGVLRPEVPCAEGVLGLGVPSEVLDHEAQVEVLFVESPQVALVFDPLDWGAYFGETPPFRDEVGAPQSTSLWEAQSLGEWGG